MLVDANILLYAADSEGPFHVRARTWLEDALNGPHRIAIPWSSLLAFVRIVTNPRAVRHPLTPPDAWAYVSEWRDAPATWTPAPGRGYADILERLVVGLDLRGNLVADAAVAALCLEHGLDIVSADSDFARFPGLRWINPLTPR